MFPFLVQNYVIIIGSYPFFYGLALVCAGIVEGLLLRKRGYDFRVGVRIWAVVCVLIVVGGRLLYVLIYLPSERLSLSWIFSLNQGGEVLYGALLFGTLGGAYVCHLKKWPLGEILDAAAVGAPLGIAIGRIGCLAKGCCHGARCNWWCAIRYPKQFDLNGRMIGSAAYVAQLNAHEIAPSDTLSLPVHPVPVYESIACLGISAILLLLWRRRVLPGRLILLFCGVYAIWRFTVEFVRVNEHVVGPLTIYQLISLGLIAACVGGVLVQRFLSKRM